VRLLLSIGLVRGVIGGLLGTGAGVGLTMLGWWATGDTVWKPGPVTAVGALVGVLAYLLSLGAFNYWLRWALGAREAGEHGSPSHGLRPQWTRYVSFDTNHKVIGIQYVATALIFLLVAGSLAMVVRLELSQPGRTIIGPGQYNSVMSLHGILMLLLVVLPAISGLGNSLIPLMIGARDMAFPRLNAFSFWIVPPAGLLMAFSLLAGGFDTGWTGYPPLSAKAPLGMQLMFLGAYLAGLSSILGAINFITTILKERAPGMGFFRMPIFVWAVLATAILQLGFTQFIAMSFLMVLLERLFGMGFFDPAKGGDVILFQHLFWFYSHPAVYIFVLPGLGAISEILPVFARKPLFAYKLMAFAIFGIAVIGSIVWVHHMSTAGVGDTMRIGFMYTTELVSVPTGMLFLSWVWTLWMGRIRLATAMLFALTAVIVFLIGGITGIPNASVPADLHLQDTYWVVAHFHFTLFGGFVFPLMAAFYYWFPKVTGRLLDERLGKVQWLLMTVGFFVLTLPMFWLGLNGMRRRIADYPTGLGFEPLNVTATVGGFLFALGVLFFVINLMNSALRGEQAPANPWRARTLEWQVSSPPPEENFEHIPQVVGFPYGYGMPGSVHALFTPSGGSNGGDPVPPG